MRSKAKAKNHFKTKMEFTENRKSATFEKMLIWTLRTCFNSLHMTLAITFNSFNSLLRN